MGGGGPVVGSDYDLYHDMYEEYANSFIVMTPASGFPSINLWH
jgi:hypothetical protein